MHISVPLIARLRRLRRRCRCLRFIWDWSFPSFLVTDRFSIDPNYKPERTQNTVPSLFLNPIIRINLSLKVGFMAGHPYQVLTHTC